MATIRKERYQRGPFGTLVKWLFIAFNVLMLIWLVGGLTSVSQIATHSEAERVGGAIGTAIGVSMILGLWVMGDIILGFGVLLTRGDKVVIEEAVADGLSGAGSRIPENSNDSWAHNADEMTSRAVQRTTHGQTVSEPVSQQPSAGFGRRQTITR
jgi:hypothetical protein